MVVKDSLIYIRIMLKINENCPIAGYTVEFSRQASSYMNYFTAHTVGSAVFFLENSNTKTIRYMGSNETNLVGSDPIWGDEARLLVPSASGKFNMLVVAYGAFSAFWGNCDVYGNCQRFSDASILVAFPNLRSNDAIESAPPSHIYNCASWAGGLTYGWMWGNITPDCYTDHTILGYGDPYVWRTWDMYFGNEPARYVGATTYVRHNGSASNGDIAVWSTDGTFKGVTHFSISGASNNHPHGYAWESKLGPWYRIFHPMNALNSSGYGSIMCFYGNTSHIINSTRSNALELSEGISFEESVERGLTVVEDVQLSTSQMELLKNDTRGFTQLAEISRLYDLWEKRIMSPEFKIVSNPYVYIETQEALDLISYSKKNKRDALIFFAGLYFNDSKKTVAKEISYIMFCNIFTEYADIMEEIKAQWKKDPYDKDGAYKAPLPEFFTKKLVKSLMEKIL